MASFPEPAPNVYLDAELGGPAVGLRTGVPAILGYATSGDVNQPRPLTLWPQFDNQFGGSAPASSRLAAAVRGFFDNGGGLCYVVRLDDRQDVQPALESGLAALAPVDAVDLICAPDIMRAVPDRPAPARRSRILAMQRAVLRSAQQSGTRFAILDAYPGVDPADVVAQSADLRTTGAAGDADPGGDAARWAAHGALYHPWPVRAGSTGPEPPCGQVAGVYARVDSRSGVHRAPANEELRTAVDVVPVVTGAQHGPLNTAGVNVIRALAGRGVRIWGCRTLSDDPAWRYVTVRRLVLTVARWCRHNLTALVFEPSGPRLWARVARMVTAYLEDLFRQGALAGRVSTEAYFVRCDAQTNTADVRAAGMVTTEIGLAPTVPSEFIRVRVVQDEAGVSVTGGKTTPGHDLLRPAGGLR